MVKKMLIAIVSFVCTVAWNPVYAAAASVEDDILFI